MRSLPRRYWHTLPLHYCPSMLATGALYSQQELRRRGLPIRPRPTAEQRDRKLGLADFVHLSFAPKTPLLADKLALGYPHALLEFDVALAEETCAALLPYNTKSWRHREDFIPIRDAGAKAEFMEAWREGKYPSAELLIETILTLAPHGVALHLASDEETKWLQEIIDALGIGSTLPLLTSPELFPSSVAPNLSAHKEYGNACREAGQLLPPPNLPFD